MTNITNATNITIKVNSTMMLPLTPLIMNMGNMSNIKTFFNASAVRLTRESKNLSAKNILGPVAKSFNLDDGA